MKRADSLLPQPLTDIDVLGGNRTTELSNNHFPSRPEDQSLRIPDGRKFTKGSDGIYRICVLEPTVHEQSDLTPTDKLRGKLIGGLIAKILAGDPNPKTVERLVSFAPTKRRQTEAAQNLATLVLNSQDRDKRTLIREQFLQNVGVMTVELRQRVASLEDTVLTTPITKMDIASIDDSLKKLNEMYPPTRINSPSGKKLGRITNPDPAYNCLRNMLQKRRGELDHKHQLHLKK